MRVTGGGAALKKTEGLPPPLPVAAVTAWFWIFSKRFSLYGPRFPSL